MTSEWTDEAVEAEIRCQESDGNPYCADALRSLLAERRELKELADERAPVAFRCRDCGIGVAADEDGLCASCGAECDGATAEDLLSALRESRAERDKAKEIGQLMLDDALVAVKAERDRLTRELEWLKRCINQATEHLAPVTASAEKGQEEPSSVNKIPMDAFCVCGHKRRDHKSQGGCFDCSCEHHDPASAEGGQEERAPLTRAEVDDGHLELGFRIEIAKARGELPGGEVSADSRAWADYADSLLKAGEENAALRKLCGEAADWITEASRLLEHESFIGLPLCGGDLVAKLREAAKV